MGFGFDIFALLALGGFYLAARAGKPQRKGNRRPPQRQAKRPAVGAKPEWVTAREKRAIAEGKLGEELVQRALHQLQMPALHDIMLEDDQGLMQVDHLVRTPWSLAVIETKHYSGFIFGNPSGKMWTQRFNRGEEHYDTEFRSPVRQNFRHIKAVEHVLEGLNIPLKGFVVFSGSARIGDTVKDNVVPLSELGERLWVTGMPRLDPATLDIAWKRLRQVSMRAEGRREEHLVMVKAKSAKQAGSFT